jgi:hypothetical protein
MTLEENTDQQMAELYGFGHTHPIMKTTALSMMIGLRPKRSVKKKVQIAPKKAPAWKVDTMFEESEASLVAERIP